MYFDEPIKTGNKFFVCVWIKICRQEQGQWNSYKMCHFSLYFNVWHRGGGGSEHVSTRICDESLS